ncbi:guanylate kinase [Candidatus Falkowbacteria bacterium]|nr:guanylate kinase [Candidatus Falkowbacteria bacterium]
MNKQGKIIILSGPSGSGKNAVVRGLLKKLKNSTYMIPHTTRKPRPKEKQGKDYFFITEQAFKKKIKNKEFLEWAHVHTDYYGTSKKILAKLQKKYNPVILAIDVNGAKTFRKHKIPHTSFFINAESEQKLISRIKKRQKNISPRELKTRLATAKNELKQAKKYDHQVINYQNKLPQTITKVLKIIKKK